MKCSCVRNPLFFYDPFAYVLYAKCWKANHKQHYASPNETNI